MEDVDKWGFFSISLWLRTAVFLPWVWGGDVGITAAGEPIRKRVFRPSGFGFAEVVMMCASRTLELHQSGRHAVTRRFSSHLAWREGLNATTAS
uniref:Putative secreted protein n=1 Tax=Amblyomma cajennense TaxID=34607 RepID=A0A023FDA4_AMBCJ